MEEEKLVSEKTHQLIENYLFAEREPLRDEVLALLKIGKQSLLQRKKIGDRILDRILVLVRTFMEGNAAWAQLIGNKDTSYNWHKSHKLFGESRAFGYFRPLMLNVLTLVMATLEMKIAGFTTKRKVANDNLIEKTFGFQFISLCSRWRAVFWERNKWWPSDLSPQLFGLIREMGRLGPSRYPENAKTALTDNKRGFVENIGFEPMASTMPL